MSGGNLSGVYHFYTMAVYHNNHGINIFILYFIILTIVFHGTRTVEYQPIFHGVT